MCERIAHYETVGVKKDGKRIQVSLTLSPIRDDDSNIVGASVVARDITERKHAEKQLQAALAKVLSGFLPICMSCKKICNDHGAWQEVEDYIRDHSEAQFSHGLCPDCSQKLYPQYPIPDAVP